MEIQIETITPEIASQYLEMNKHNRPIRPTHVQFLAREIRDDKWLENGSTIVFNGDKLEDGQHRLMAVVAAGKPIKTIVVRKVNQDCFPTIDTGIIRTAGDVLSIGGEKHPANLASAARLIIGYHTKRLINRVKVSNGSVYEFVNENPGLKESLAFILSLKSKSKILSRPTGAALHYLMAKKDKDLADALFVFIYTGNVPSPSDTFIALREKLIGCSNGHAKPRANILFVYVVKAWNARRKGTHMRVFKFLEGEEVPKIR